MPWSPRLLAWQAWRLVITVSILRDRYDTYIKFAMQILIDYSCNIFISTPVPYRFFSLTTFPRTTLPHTQLLHTTPLHIFFLPTTLLHGTLSRTSLRHIFFTHADPLFLFFFLPFPSYVYLSVAAYWKKLTYPVL